jgi:SAM-dependent methyltransferase
MRLSSIPENLTEAAALAAGRAPTPLIDTLVGLLLARTVITGTALGVFDALERGPLSAFEVSSHCRTDQQATERLLRALCGCGYLAWEKNRYQLSRRSRMWLLREGPKSIRPAILHRDLDLRFMRFEEYVKAGAIQDFHAALDEKDWEIYHEGQASHASLILDEVIGRTPIPENARVLYDLGGGHGLYSFGFCERYPELQAKVFDLDVSYGSSRLKQAGESIKRRVKFAAADVRHAPLPKDSCDVVLLVNVLHHFDEETARGIFERIEAALRPRGIFAVLDAVRPNRTEQSEQLESLLDLYFGATSGAGLWTVERIRALQVGVGLAPKVAQRLRFLPCCKLQIATKPSSQ